jgi:methyl-accepting chemotaxis protein
MSGTFSIVLSQLDKNRQRMEKVITEMESMSNAAHCMQQQLSEISKISALVSELAQFNSSEVHNISRGMSEVQERLQGGSTESSSCASD